MEKHRLLIIGFGAIAQRLVSHLDNTQWQVMGLRRSVGGLPGEVEPIAADYTKKKQLFAALSAVEVDYLLLTLTPSAFNAQAYRQCYQQGIENILASLSCRPKHIFFVSSTSVYGDFQGAVVNEQSVVEPLGFSGEAMLACENLLSDSGTPTTALRCGGVYHEKSMRVINKVLKGDASLSSIFTNRIHREDCAAAIAHLLMSHIEGKKLSDCYLLVDNEPCPMATLEKWVAKELDVSLATLASANDDIPQDKRTVGDKRCSNDLLLSTGYELLYPSYREGYHKAIMSFRADISQ